MFVLITRRTSESFQDIFCRLFWTAAASAARRRFSHALTFSQKKSGVALHFPPHSKKRRLFHDREMAFNERVCSPHGVPVCSMTERIFPVGSLNQAMVGPFPRIMPFVSVLRSGRS